MRKWAWVIACGLCAGCGSPVAFGARESTGPDADRVAEGLVVSAWQTNSIDHSFDGAETPAAWSRWAGTPFHLQAAFDLSAHRAKVVYSSDRWASRREVKCRIGADPAAASIIDCTIDRTPAGATELFLELEIDGAGTVYLPGGWRNHSLEGMADGLPPYFTDSFNTAFGASNRAVDADPALRAARVSLDGMSTGASSRFALWNASQPQEVCVPAGQLVPVRVDIRDLESGTAGATLRFSFDGWRTIESRAMLLVTERSPGAYYAQIGYEAALPPLAEGQRIEATISAEDVAGNVAWLTDFGRNLVVRTCP